MLRTLLCGLVAVGCLWASAYAEETSGLPGCATIEEVQAMIDFPGEEAQPVPAERGRIRYVSQDIKREPDFCDEYWIGGEPGDKLDLTLEKDENNKPYDFYASTMCTRAAYSMALSYLGVDLTPGEMSAMLQERDIPMHYDDVTELLPEIERVTFRKYIFQTMFEKYQTDDRYSPVYVYLQRPSGSYHALLVVARQEDGRYIVVDSRYHEVDGEGVRVYALRFNRDFREILTSDFNAEQAGSKIKGFYQWRLVDEDETESE